MSIEAMATVLNSGNLPPRTKLVLLGIANHDGDGGAWPSIETLARYACCSERTVQREISKLVDAGLVTVHTNAGGTRQTRPDRRPNVYQIHINRVVDNTVNGVTQMSPRDSDGVTPVTERGDTAMSPEPSLNHPVTNKRDSYAVGVPVLCVVKGCGNEPQRHKFKCSTHVRQRHVTPCTPENVEEPT